MEREVWNDVYTRVAPERLPWYGISLSDEVISFLQQHDTGTPVLATGVGVGDTAQEIYSLGFEKLVATDISDEAIEIARTRFPHIRFEAIATESLSTLGLEPTLVIDWLVIHHISPEGLQEYLRSLAAAANTLAIAYLYKEGAGVQQSYVKRDSPTYNHDPRDVEALLPDFDLREESRFTVYPNKAYDGESRQHGAVLQIYSGPA